MSYADKPAQCRPHTMVTQTTTRIANNSVLPHPYQISWQVVCVVCGEVFRDVTYLPTVGTVVP